MRLAHLSDLHFGRRVDLGHLRSLEEDLPTTGAELLVITGDLTDRGRTSQFRWARDFLKSLGIPFIAVPGNREVSASAFWEWMVPSLAMARFRSFFGTSDRILHQCEKSKVVFFGLNSVHPFPSWPGKIPRATRYWLKQQAAEMTECSKVLFLHHPVLPVIRGSSFWAHTLSDAGELLNICSEMGINLILQGHKHRSAVAEVHVPARNARIVVSAAGAPLMSGWDSVYHLIDLSPARITVRPREFLNGAFVETAAYRFPNGGNHI